MNREIKFRAWVKSEKIMSNVYAIYLGEYAEVRLKGGYDMLDLHEDVELMQYTGIKDSNGVEIYEGDIVKIPQVKGFPYDRDCKIKYISGGFYCAPIGSTVGCYLCEINNLRAITLKGNIFENPELLEQ